MSQRKRASSIKGLVAEGKVDTEPKSKRLYKERIRAAIVETKRLRDKELSYSEDLQNKGRINQYTKHIAKLEKYLEEDTCTIHGIKYF